MFAWPQAVNDNPEVEVDDGHDDEGDDVENRDDLKSWGFRAMSRPCKLCIEWRCTDHGYDDVSDDKDPHQEVKDNLNHSEDLRSITTVT